MKKFIHIKSEKFKILPDEEEILVNEGTYGKALSEYLKEKLTKIGYDIPFFCCEDWGWWIEIKNKPISFGICIYSSGNKEKILDFFCTDSLFSEKVWSWRKFKYINMKPYIDKLHNDLISIFENDKDVELISTSLEEPFS